MRGKKRFIPHSRSPYLDRLRNENRDFWARGEVCNCCFIVVMLRVITVNSKLARGVGRETGTATGAVLALKLQYWWWHEHVEDSSCALQAEFTHWHWEGPESLRVLPSCPLPLGSSSVGRMFYCKWESQVCLRGNL